MIASIAGEKYRSQDQPLYEVTVKQLLNQLGCPNEYIKIRRSGSFWENRAKIRIYNGTKYLQFLMDILNCNQSVMLSRINSGYYDEVAINGNREDTKRHYLLWENDYDTVDRMINEWQALIAKDQEALANQDYSNQ